MKMNYVSRIQSNLKKYKTINTNKITTRILDGSYKNQYLQVGANQSQGIKVSIKETKWDEELYLSKSTSVTGKTHADGVAGKSVIDGNATVGYTEYAYNSNIFTVSASKVVTATKKEVLATDYTTWSDAIGAYDASDATKAAAAEEAAQKLGFSSIKDVLKTDGTVDTTKYAATNGTLVTEVKGDKISGLIDNVDQMIKSVTTERSKLGAVQNRLEHTIAKDIFEGKDYPWEVLPLIGQYIIELGKTLDKEEYNQVADNVWIHKTAKVFESAYINGPAIFLFTINIMQGNVTNAIITSILKL